MRDCVPYLLFIYYRKTCILINGLCKSNIPTSLKVRNTVTIISRLQIECGCNSIYSIYNVGGTAPRFGHSCQHHCQAYHLGGRVQYESRLLEDDNYILH